MTDMDKGKAPTPTPSGTDADNDKGAVVAAAKGEVVDQGLASDHVLFLQSAKNYETYAKQRSRSRVRRKLIQLFSFVMISTMISTFYYGFLASDRYTSLFQFTIEASRQSVPSLLDGLLGGSGGSGGGKETGLLFEYIQSPAILERLDEWLDLRGHYSNPDIDFISRLSPDASREAFLEYYRDLIEIDITTTPNVFTVGVQAFDPDFAAAIADAIIVLSEDMINQVNEKALADAVSYSQRDLEVAEKRLSSALEKLRHFQDEEGDLDPQQSAASVAGIVALLEGQLVQAKSELTETLSFMRPDSVQVVSLKAKIAAIEQQIEEERLRLAGEGNPTGERVYSAVVSEFERVRMEAEFGRRAYEASLASFEVAKAEAIRTFSYVIAFVPATLPDAASEPQRMLMIVSTFLGSCVLFMLLSFVAATIRDHVDG